MDLPIGCAGKGVLHTDREVPGLATRFRLVAEAGVLDYGDRSPSMGEIDQHLAASARHGMPTRATGWCCVPGRGEPLLEWNLEAAAEIGALVHDTQIMTRKLDGTPATSWCCVPGRSRANGTATGRRCGSSPGSEPKKEVLRQLMRRHATHPESRLGQISTGFIPPPDHGGGARYSIFGHNVACARWLRGTCATTLVEQGRTDV